MYSILDALEEQGNLSNFLKIVKTAEADKILAEDGPYTIFAPDNLYLKEDEVAKYKSGDDAVQYLRDHVATGEYETKDLPDGYRIITLSNQVFTFCKNGRFMVGEANIVQRDINCKNGIIHVIDKVWL